MGMTSIPPGSGLGSPNMGTGMVSADEAKAYADWQNAGGQGDFQYNPQQTQPPVQGLPTDGTGGGKGGIGNMLPDVMAGQMPQLPGGAQLPGLDGQTQTASFPNQQQPITQGTGQLPPGFGALSPIDRSQISPNASMGMTGGGFKGRDLSGPNPNITTISSDNRLQQQSGMRPAGAPAPKLNVPGPSTMTPPTTQRPTVGVALPGSNRAAPAPRMNDQTMFNQSAAARAGSQFGNFRGQTAYGNAPTNRFAPPNAPGVRSAPITRPRVR